MRVIIIANANTKFGTNQEFYYNIKCMFDDPS